MNNHEGHEEHEDLKLDVTSLPFVEFPDNEASLDQAHICVSTVFICGR